MEKQNISKVSLYFRSYLLLNVQNVVLKTVKSYFVRFKLRRAGGFMVPALALGEDHLGSIPACGRTLFIFFPFFSICYTCPSTFQNDCSLNIWLINFYTSQCRKLHILEIGFHMTILIQCLS